MKQEKRSKGCLTRSDTNLSVQPQNMARSLKKRDCPTFVAKTKMLIGCAVADAAHIPNCAIHKLFICLKFFNL